MSIFTNYYVLKFSDESPESCINIYKNLDEIEKENIKILETILYIFYHNNTSFKKIFDIIPDKLKNNLDFAWLAIQIDIFNYQYFSNEIRNNYAIFNYVVDINPFAINTDELNKELNDILINKKYERMNYALCELQKENKY